MLKLLTPNQQIGPSRAKVRPGNAGHICGAGYGRCDIARCYDTSSNCWDDRGSKGALLKLGQADAEGEVDGGIASNGNAYWVSNEFSINPNCQAITPVALPAASFQYVEAVHV